MLCQRRKVIMEAEKEKYEQHKDKAEEKMSTYHLLPHLLDKCWMEVGRLHHVTIKPFQECASYILGPHWQYCIPKILGDMSMGQVWGKYDGHTPSQDNNVFNEAGTVFSLASLPVRVGSRLPLGRRASSRGALAKPCL